MKKLAVVFSIAVLGMAGVLVYFPEPVEAIPGAQEVCDTSFIVTGSPTLVPVPGMTVSINNGLRTRNVVVQFGADAGVGSGATLVIDYIIDGVTQGRERSFTVVRGGSFAAIDVYTLGPGTHTIQVGWRCDNCAAGGLGDAVMANHRCLTAEGRTK